MGGVGCPKPGGCQQGFYSQTRKAANEDQDTPVVKSKTTGLIEKTKKKNIGERKKSTEGQ